MRSTFAVALALALGVCGLSFAAAPSAAITGPTKAAACSLVVLDASDSQAAEGGLIWLPVNFAGEIVTAEGGRKAYLVAPRSGRLVLLLVAIDLDEGKAKVDRLEWSIDVGGEPGPGPGPDPEPPVPPDGSLSEQVKALKATVDLPPERLAKSSAALATAFETLATRIGAGGYASVDELLAGLEARTAAALGSDLNAWGEFRDKLGALFEQLADAKKLETLDDHAAMFLEVAKGLR